MAERHLAARFNRPGPRGGRPPHVRRSPATATSWRASRTRRRRSPGTSSSASSSSSTTPTASASPAPRTCRSPTTSAQVFEGYGWHVVKVADGNDLEALARATDAAKAETDRPSLVIVQDRDRLRQPEAGHVRRARLAAQRRAGRSRRSASSATPPRSRSSSRAEALAHLRGAVERGKEAEAEWRGRFEAYRKAHPDLAAELERAIDGRAAEGLGPGHPDLRDGRQADRHALGRREDHQRDRGPRAGASRRLRRPQRLDGDGPQGGGRLPEPGDRGGRAPGRRGRRVGLRGPQRPLRRARARDGGRLLRPRAPRRRHPVLGHLLHLRRLHAPGHPPRRAHEAAARSTSSPTTASASARTGRRTSRSSTPRRCGPSRSSR